MTLPELAALCERTKGSMLAAAVLRDEISPDLFAKLVRVAMAAEAYRKFADENPYGSRGDDALNEALDALKDHHER